MAQTISVSVRGDKQFRAALTGSANTLIAAVGIELERQADEAIAYVRDQQGALFTNPSGSLSRSLWKHPFKAQGTRVTVQAGWGVKYGRVLEYGPRKKVWTILPGKGPVAPGWNRAGQPTKYLHWVDQFAGIGPRREYFRTKVTHVWTEAQKRPHWKKAIDEAAGKRRGAMRRAIKAAISKSYGGVK